MGEREKSLAIVRRVIRPDLTYSMLSPYCGGIEPLYVTGDEVIKRKIFTRDNPKDSYKSERAVKREG